MSGLQLFQSIRPFGGANVILGDPPWKYQMYSQAGEGRSPQQHYPCMELDEIAALPVSALANPQGCLLVMWSTAPFLEAAFGIVRAWGFEPKSVGSWVKETKASAALDVDDSAWKARMATGYIFRSACEFWIVATLGNPAYHDVKVSDFPHPSRGIPNCFFEPPREHSRKPDWMHRALEVRAPGPYVEIFARTTRRGWISWGNETAKFEAAT